MKNHRPLLLTLGLWLCSLTLQAQNAPIPRQAESGVVGADWNVLDDTGVRYVSIKPTSTINAQNPGTAARIITYSVTFPAAGTYSLYARIRVGAGGFSDDSFYYGNGFGTKSATNDTNWITVNGLAAAGFTGATDVVTGSGTASTGVWKWINLSRLNLLNSGSETPIRFAVTADALTQTFQIGAREDGLEFDTFAFGLTSLSYTVNDLDTGQPGTAAPLPPPYTPTGPPLATSKPKFLGGIWSPAQLTNFTAYFNQVVPSNVGKWGSVESTRDVMNWTSLDAAYRLAKDNGFPFRLHVLIWGNQQPRWIASLPPAEQLEEIKEWFAAVAQRYPDIDFLEVVNEPLHDAPDATPSVNGDGGNYINALGGTGTTGWDWVLTSFRLAREYFPNTRLMLNDYSVENSVANATRYLNIITLLQQEKLIDAIGIQGHSFSTRPASSAALTSSLDILAASGLPLYITELDVNGSEDAAQLSEYQRIFPIFWEHPAVKGVSIFGYLPGADAEAHLAYSNGAERPALVWLKNYVRNTALPCNVSVTSRLTKPSSCAGTDGAINLMAQGGGTASYTYSWVGPNGFTATSEDLIGLAPGTYTVTVIAPNSNCSTTADIVLTPEPDTKAPTVLAKDITVTLDATGTAIIQTSTLDNGSFDECGIASLTVDKAQFSCTDIGPNTVTLTATDNSGNVSAGTAVVTVVGVIPSPSIVAEPTSPTYTGGLASTIYLGYGPQSVQLRASGGSIYNWVGSELSLTQGAVTVFTPTAAGTYTFTVTATNTYGCSASATQTIEVIDVRCGNNNDKVLVCHNGHQVCIAASAVNAHLRNHSGDQLGSCPTTVARGTTTATGSVASMHGASAQVTAFEAYPNPVTDQATITFRPTQAGKAQVKVYNQLGVLVATLYDGQVESGRLYSVTLNGQPLAGGVYSCQLITNGSVVNKRLMVSR